MKKETDALEHQIFVGREAELQQLMELARSAFADEARVVFVTGEAGIGKSYLVKEFFRPMQMNLSGKKE